MKFSSSVLTSALVLCIAELGVAQQHTHGTMVGTVTPSSAVVWTRASLAAQVTVLYATNSSLTNPSQTAQVATVATNDHTVKIPLTGLAPSTRYYYATKITNPSQPSQFDIGRIGTFRTPPPKSTNGKVTFVATGDIKFHHEFDLFDKMRLENPDFFVCLGDMPYADLAASQSDYWLKHKEVRNNAKWFDFIPSTICEAIWDDHEVVNDWDKTSNPNSVAWGTKAVFDYWPLPNSRTEIYRSIRWGKALELFLLDCRSKRDANSAPSTQAKTILGSAQKSWLKNALRQSDATFKIIVSSVPTRWGKASMDDWDGFVFERREILDYIAANRIKNVSVITADTHLMSVHHHRDGIREYMCGPGAQVCYPAAPADPEVRYRASVRNFVKVSVDPTVTPAKITFEYIDPSSGDSLYKDQWSAETRSTAHILTDKPAGGVHLQGPYFFHNHGNDFRIPSIQPGPYHLSFDPQPDCSSYPTDIDLTIPPNSHVSIAGRWNDLEGPTTLLSQTFDQPLTGHSIIDEAGATGGPSAWIIDAGVLRQTGAIGGPIGSSDSDRPGTMLILGDAAWTNYTATSRLKSLDSGRIGMVFRYQDPNNFYRFFMDSKRAVRRLEKKVNGVFTTLAEELTPYLPYSFYEVACVADGKTLKVILDGHQILSATDSTYANGQVGFYLWNVLLSEFEELNVEQGDTTAPAQNLVTQDNFNDNILSGWTSEDHATSSGPSFWIEVATVLFQLSPIGDIVSGNTIANPGTVMLNDATIPDDMQFSLSAVNTTDGTMGAVFRYTDAANHYRFVMNRKSRYRQLQKVVNGTWTVLKESRQDFNYLQWYRLRILSVGSRHRVYVDDELFADITDTSHASGKVGFYAWQSSNVVFDNALVQRPQSELPVLVGVSTGSTTILHAKAPASPGMTYGLGLAFSMMPPMPCAWLNATDPRFIHLAPDDLFLYTLTPATFWSGLHGKLDANGKTTATINWPPLPGLKGMKIYAGGWTGLLTTQPVQQIFPTVTLIYP
ncbi:MAG: alkaline phosphatase D family protein [Planctomycetota bacterium]|nr:alkaline phosphatase D family protein [Planctomycetota bacterium]